MRLLGVGVTSLADDAVDQLTFDDVLAAGAGADASQAAGRSSIEVDEATNSAIDEIRRRFGDAAIGPAVLATEEGLGRGKPGDEMWGPAQLPPR